VVLALPRAGVPVGFELARALDAALDVFVVRKLRVPSHEEFAFGALATGGSASSGDRDMAETLDALVGHLERGPADRKRVRPALPETYPWGV
jgi:predicted phosphoribosyltransferase